MRLQTFLIFLAAVLLFAGMGRAEIAGGASVIDGDTIDVHDQRIRLHGIDAPEAAQLCAIDGEPYRCGQTAAFALANRIRQQTVACEERDIDRYGRIVAVCSAGGVDLNGFMVRHGWALAYREYSDAYVGAEAQARAEGLGMWRGDFVSPWAWRRGERLVERRADSAEPGCRIKGNISRSGERIYHMPGQQHYGRTRINSDKGEQWFCSERAAEAAGWRRAKN